MAHASNFTIKVFYTWSQTMEQLYDPDFKRSISWDIPLLQAYDHTFVNNVSTQAGSHHFNGIVNPTLIKEIEDWKADAVLVYGWSFSSHLKAMRHFHKKIPVLFRGDSTLLDEPSHLSLKKLVRRTFLRWVYAFVDYALYVGTANKQYFKANGLADKQLVFAPHAIDNNRFAGNDNELSADAINWRRELGIKDDEVVFLFAGKLTSKKDPELLIKAFIELRNDKTKLIIVGNGELENDLKNRYSSQPGIIFLDFKNQSLMPVVYRLGDIFVLPSKGPGETWGLVVNEAMACKKAVITSDKCGSYVDLIKNGKNGYVFNCGNLQQLKQCMEPSLKNYRQMGEAGYQIIQQWNYNATIEALEQLFEKELA
jgi:glycosyltransferase involved in cell wall biosynthesis